MYGGPATRAALTEFWAAWRDRIRDAGLSAPDTLDDDRPAVAASTPPFSYADAWWSPDLVVSQTCGLPFARDLQDAARLIATPCYDAPGCVGPMYSSAIVVRSTSAATRLADLRGATFAANSDDSQSGYHAFRVAIRALAANGRFVAQTVMTGSHAASLDAVADGTADAAAIDCVSLALARRNVLPALAKVRVLDWTPPTPGLPFITAGTRSDREVEILRETLRDCLRDPALEPVRAAMLLIGVELLTPADYAPLARAASYATASGLRLPR